jgi:uncharacterized caspase-like protein
MRFCELKYIRNDIFVSSDLLISTCGLEDNNVVIHTTQSKKPPTRSGIIRSLIEPKGQPVDRLFFFFSGHGFHSVKDDRDYLLPTDTVLGSLEETALSVESLLQYLRTWGAGKTFMFIDACRVTAWRGKAIEIVAIDALKMDSTRPAGFATFWSYYREERSFECAELESGLFAYAVREGLGQRGQCSTVHELNACLSRFVPETSAKFELPRQSPWCQIEPPGMANTVIVSEKILDDRQLESLAFSEFRSRSVNRRSTKSVGRSAR